VRNIIIIALNTFKESIRDKILYNIVFLALAMAIMSILLGEWSVFDRAHVIKGLTFSIMSVSGLLISIFVGISLVQKEIQKRTVLTLLSKPLFRGDFILGKYVGLIMVVSAHLTLLTVVFYGILWMTDSSPQWILLQAIFMIFIEMALVVAMAVLFSSFSTPVLSALFTMGLYISGHLSNEILKQIALLKVMSGDPFVKEYYTQMEFFAKLANYILPNLHHFNIQHQIIHGLALPENYIFTTVAYGFGYIVLLLSISVWWFSKRDFV
jgi:ABC-type transport system involved in multi-copper enzyme maturation permease subunit